MSQAAITGFSGRVMPPVRAAVSPLRVLVVLWFCWSLAEIIFAAPGIGALDLGDTDNFMHLVALRDFLGGQGWFDVSQHRWAGGGAMHFSRLADLPMAALQLGATPFIDAAAAERFALVAAPPLLFLAFLYFAARAAHPAAGGRGAIAAVVVAIATTAITQQFQPGRIDHHGLALVFAMAAVAFTASSAPRPRFAALSALVALAVSLEAAPVFAAALALAAWFWIDRREARYLAAFGAASFAASIILLFATQGFSVFAQAPIFSQAPIFLQAPIFSQASGRAAACDAFGAPAAIGAMLAGLAAIALAFSPLATRAGRGAAALIAGGASLGVTLALFPQCLGGPFAEVDGLARSVWLASVGEAGAPLKLVVNNPGMLISYCAFPLAAILAGIANFKAQPTRGALAPLVFLIFASVLMLAALRGAVFASALAIPVVAIFLARASHRVRLDRVRDESGALTQRRTLAGGARFCALALLIAPISYAALGAEISAMRANGAADPRMACDNVAAIRTLGALEPSLLFTPIDQGPAILALTPHEITAAPYHRNVAAINRAILGFSGDADEARAAIIGSGARFLVFCPSTNEAAAYRRRAPDGLAARLSAGDPPDWLRLAVPPRDGAIGVWEITGRQGAAAQAAHQGICTVGQLKGARYDCATAAPLRRRAPDHQGSAI